MQNILHYNSQISKKRFTKLAYATSYNEMIKKSFQQRAHFAKMTIQNGISFMAKETKQDFGLRTQEVKISDSQLYTV